MVPQGVREHSANTPGKELPEGYKRLRSEPGPPHVDGRGVCPLRAESRHCLKPSPPMPCAGLMCRASSTGEMRPRPAR